MFPGPAWLKVRGARAGGVPVRRLWFRRRRLGKHVMWWDVRVGTGRLQELLGGSLGWRGVAPNGETNHPDRTGGWHSGAFGGGGLFDDCNQPIDPRVLDYLAASTDPLDFDAIDPVTWSQPEMQT